MRKWRRLFTALALVSALTMQTHAIVGVGAHWGFDFTLNMDESLNELVTMKELFQPADFKTFLGSSGPIADSLAAQIGITAAELNAFIDTLTGAAGVQAADFSASLPVTLSRSEWSRTIFNFGGKIFIDIIPVLDAIEVSLNFGVWEYQAWLNYPSGVRQENLTVDQVSEVYETGDYSSVLVMEDTIALTLENFGYAYFGLDGTPYAKLHIDATVRKNIIAVPNKLKIFRLYAGGGPTVHFATPIITPGMVEETVGDIIDGAIEASNGDLSQLATQLTGSPGTKPENHPLRPVVEKVLEGMTVPKFGMHIIVGSMVKLPVVPIGFYLDGKLQVPFGDMDEEAGLKGYGVLINGGITVGI
ncbi:MAG: hypothetical protein GF398_01275 [Chitinivibrionales bacterium]|nr:hypothetical protein [Chitinivibrionales bacterium]